jgi:hypothetical protein
MRDIIWTVIVLWVVWKVVDAFRNFSASRIPPQGSTTHNQNHKSETNFEPAAKKPELKPDAGEYIDYEEVK